MKKHSLFASLGLLSGNARGCVFTEPLWGIPYNLYIPYVSIYMVALGLNDQQIGLIASISWGFQVGWAMFSGVITDKLGRRRTTLLFDIISWVIPSLLSAIAQNFWFFLIAGIVNSVWRVVHVSWSCLLVEDTDEEQLVDIYSWIYIAGLLVAFFAPIAGAIMKRYTLIPTMRGLYLFAAVMFAIKATATYFLTSETEQGKTRMRETQHQSVFTAFGEYKDVGKQFIHAPQTLYTTAIMLVMSAAGMINGNFWAILVTEKLHIANENLALFQVIRSIIMILFFFVVAPRMRTLHFKRPMLISFLGLISGQLVLVLAPEKSYAMLIVSIFLDACSFATVSPLVDRMLVKTVDPKERARIQSLVYMAVILLTSPFGWIGGLLSSINHNLPFILNMALYLFGGVLVFFAARESNKPVEQTVPEMV